MKVAHNMNEPAQPSYKIPPKGPACFNIHTPRLHLRRPGPSFQADIRAYEEIYYTVQDDPFYWGNKKPTPHNTLFEDALDDWEYFGAGPYIIAEKATGTDIGIAGFRSGFIQQRNCYQLFTSSLMRPEYRNNGFGTEVRTAILEVADAIGLASVYSTVHKDNAASRHITEKLGGQIDRTLTYGDLIYYVVPSIKTRAPVLTLRAGGPPIPHR